jgi:transcriptional regulator with XRE-family HTH domain
MSKDKKFNPEVAKIALKLTGEFFRDRRKELGMSQTQLANCAGIRQHYLSAFENGEQNISFNVLIALSGCLRLEIQYVTKDLESVPGFPENQGKNN